ncbi:MAG TPA: TonB-dependent receptor [Chitinophagaceae bacterium]|nr:TonB-dependent receptor [Chitinophagaceae bacterium]
MIRETTAKRRERIGVARSAPGRLLVIVLLNICLLGSLTASAQDKTIRGRITTETGAPVAGASVQVKGTSLGTTANENGEYTITAARGTVLVISNVGYTDREVIVGDNAQIDIQLTTAVQDMSEVVVVGYGTQRKKDVTGAVVSVSEKALREVPVPNLQQALIGRAAGLEINQVGNQPGAGAQIRIRGIRSITGSNEPLIVLDNIPWDGNLNDINPDEIASVDILKDASATAIYGSRGANGVILVTTKKGRGGDTRVSYNGYHGIGTVANKYPVFNADEYRLMRDLSTWNQGYMAEELNGIAQGRNTDWQDLLYDNSYRTDHNINVSGGANGNTFSLGGGYYKETTVLPGEDFTRFSLRASIDARVGKKIKIGITTQNSLTHSNGLFVSPIFRTLALSPLMPGYNPDGSVYLTPAGNIDDVNGFDRYSPLILREGPKNWDNRTRRLRTFNTLYGEYEIVKGLRYRLNLGLNYAQQFQGQFQGADKAISPSFSRPGDGNIARVSNGETWGYTAENLLFYDKTIKDHKFNFTGLYSIQESQSFDNWVQKEDITEDFVRFYNLAQSSPIDGANTGIGGSETSWALISYMARLNYAFRDRYLLTLTYRRDGSSRLAPGNQWFDYPAVSAGWVVSDEAFMGNIKGISYLKLRAGWGRTSNQSVNPYDSKGLVSNSNGLPTGGDIGAAGAVIRYNYGPTIVTGYDITTLPNPNLSWEFTSTLNLGLDFGLFNNRLTGTLEYYTSKTDKILFGLPLPITSGVAGNFMTNVGEMSNKGFELSLSSVNYQSASGFSWSTDLNLFTNKNRLMKLSSGVEREIGAQLFVGHSMTAIYDYQKLGIWQAHEAAEAAAVGSTPGQIKLADLSGPNGHPDGVIDASFDRTIIGDMDADLQGGLTNRFSYKGFDVSIVMHARFGGLLLSQIHAPGASYISQLDGKRNSVKVDFWTPTNPSNWFPMPAGQHASLSSVSDGWRTLGYYDASFVRIRSINLGYTFSNNVLKKIGAHNARVYLTLDNVALLWSPFFKQTGFDPQATAAGERGQGGAYGNIRDNGRGNGALVLTLGTPPRRTFTFGLNITL